MNTLIITGASGFVGSNVIKHFAQSTSFETLSLNLREKLPARLPDANAIVHLAGKAHDMKNASDPKSYFDINYGLTKALFDLFLESDIDDFIYFSSVKAVADNISGVLTEEYQPNPMTAYGQSKLKAEQYLLEKHLPAGKRLFIFRPCMIHGPGNKGNLNLLYQVIRKGIPYPLGAFDNQRSFLSIDNLLFVLETVLSRPQIQGGIFNLSDDEALDTTEVINIIGKASQTKPKIWDITPGLITAMAKVGDKLHLPLTSERLQKLTENYVVSNVRLKSSLGIARLPMPARDGLSKTIRSFI